MIETTIMLKPEEEWPVVDIKDDPAKSSLTAAGRPMNWWTR
jgi:hypothetical protein